MESYVRRMASAAGFLSIFAIIAAGLALQDIYHQENDLTLEWAIVQTAFVVFAIFVVAALIALRRPA